MTDHKPSTPPNAPLSWPHGPTGFERRFGNNTTRIVVAVIAIPLILGVVFAGGWWFVLLVAGMSTGALLEFYWMLEKRGIYPNKVLGVVAGLLLLLPLCHGEFSTLLGLNDYALSSSGGQLPAVLFGGWELPVILALLLLLVLLSLTTELRRDNRQALHNVMGTLAGFLYVSLCMGALLGLHHLVVANSDLLLSRAGHVVGESGGSPSFIGGTVVMLVLLGIWTCDSFAYFGGRAFGKHKLFERVSPKKTWEGAIAGAVAAVAVCTGLGGWLGALTWYDGLFIGLAAGVFGQIGDLVESHIKRGCEVKDSSQIIPGHGGILDRFDSLLFVAPLVYLYLIGIVLIRIHG